MFTGECKSILPTDAIKLWTNVYVYFSLTYHMRPSGTLTFAFMDNCTLLMPQRQRYAFWT